MLTRRQVLRGSVAAACVAGGALHAEQRVSAVKRTCFLPKLRSGDLLAQESAQGFQSLLPDSSFVYDDLMQRRAGPGTLIIVPAVRTLPAHVIRELRKNVEGGAWVIWERAANFSGQSESDSRQLHARFFDLSISDPIRPTSTYVRYRWPIEHSVRAFHDVAFVRCFPGEAIAEYEGRPVAIKRRIGAGGIVFLGTMLGPNIRAEEREACAVGRGMLQKGTDPNSPYGGA